MKMPLLMFDSSKQQKHYGGNSKMLMPSSYFDYNITGNSASSAMSHHKNTLIPSSSSKLPFARDFKVKTRDKYTAAAYNHPPPPLATQQAIAMMNLEYELGNNLVLSNTNGHYKSKMVNAAAVEKKR